MNLKKYFCGNELERMPNPAFRIMSIIFRIMDIFYPFEKRIAALGLQEGFTVVDYGCGPGRYIERVSRLVGKNGKVYAVDIHDLAIKSVKKMIEKKNLTNVEPVLTDGYSCNIKDHVADVVYALDMFHMISDHAQFLKELHRIVKKDGFLVIDDGHQPREKTKAKLAASKLWHIAEETENHLKCTPI